MLDLSNPFRGDKCDFVRLIYKLPAIFLRNYPMKFILFFLLLSNFVLYGQDDKYWYAFHVEDTINNPLSLSLGFKDINGKVKIKPIYLSPMTENKRFEKVIALTEYHFKNWVSYYTNKDGKKFGIDSLYTFDTVHDTEQEGFIRFSIGKQLDSIGLFNSNGKIVIEPKYNSLSKVNNGLVIALIGANKIKEHEYNDCNHWHYEGGKKMLLDTLGKILIDNFNEKDLYLNLYTQKITEKFNAEKFRHNFRNPNGNYYSFINTNEEFQEFLKNDFIKNISNKNLSEYLFINIKYLIEKDKIYLKRLKRTINQIKMGNITFSKIGYTVYKEEEIKLMKDYLDNADNIVFDKYPIYGIVNENGQFILCFIRTENGYKIIE